MYSCACIYVHVYMHMHREQDVCWSDDWLGALRRRTLKREEAAKQATHQP